MLRPLGIAIALVVYAYAGSVQAQTLRQLHSFDAASEGTSTAALMQAPDGLFYGVNRFDGPHGRGTLFRMTPNGTLTVLHAFTGGADGGRPGGPLVEGPDGHLYGTAAEGGLHTYGVAFRITLDGSLSVLHAFGATADAGRGPGALTRSADGDFYGTSCAGGAANAGSVFRMTATGEVTPLYAFTNGADGRCPGGLLMASDGMLYGVASGGPLGEGVAFRMTPAGAFLKIHDYVRSVEGGAPGPLLQSRFDGLLYGTTNTTGGPFNFTSGTVYRMTTAGDVQVLHTFGNSQYGGMYPVGRLVEGTDGNFYGVTSHGGLPYSYYTTSGTIFRITRDGTHTVLRLFRGQPDGMNPQTGLLQASDGHLYGSATGGFSGQGMIFRLETFLCTSTVDAFYSPASQFVELTYRLQSAGAGTWSLWAITSSGAAPLWSVPIGAVPQPASFTVGHVLPPSGPILFVTHLDVPGFGSCGGWSFVDSGTPPAPAAIR
jgi:uncharacterized repeat protein (TIGR03803 family)